MRVNVYSQELTSEIEMVLKVGKNDEGNHTTFEGVRWYLHSSEYLHHSLDDDDRSAITIWLPRSTHRRKELAKTLIEMAALVTETIDK
jgi:hypothetical protein